MIQNSPRSTNLLAAPVVLLLVVVCALITWPRERRNPVAAVASTPGRTEQAVVVPAHKFTNELVHESSPYLRQHAHNPVNWRPWSDKAFELARRENKPVFLSVGYSTCYWCHVMERESFENEEVAALLNEHFICIKVDREELPNVDEQYLLATQIMGGRGGWPNSVWLMPDRRPWMAGTYIPRAAFLKGLQQLAELWRDEPATIERQAAAFEQEIRRIAVNQQSFEEQPLNRELIARYLAHARGDFDAEHGGFGGRPKFPPHGDLRLITHEAQHSGDEQLTQMVTQTLDAIAAGGIRDHLGGGFHRYATDDHWFLPHFEKMLYDNAQLLRAYTEGYRLTGNEYYREVVAEIFAWLLRDMTHPAGGFYSAIDAESEQEEGKFYVWSLAELTAVLGPSDATRLATMYGATADGNFVEEATGHRSGSNVLFLPAELADEQSSTEFAAMRRKLFAARGRRSAPHKDEKILASWNGLMIAALAQAGRELQEPAYTRAAIRAADYLTLHMLDRAGLKRSASDRAARLPGYLDDYAHVIEGLLELHQTTGDSRWLSTAQQLAEAMLQKFEDPMAGGFYFTSAEHDSLIIRSKNLLGGGNVPSPNGVAAEVLWRLGKATGKSRYTQSAQRTLESVSGLMHRAPQATESMLLATTRMLEDREPASPTHSAFAHFNSTAVNVAAYSSATAAQAGDSLRIAVRLNIAPGWHLYGENEDAEFVLPTTVALVDNRWAKQTRLEVPAGLEKADPVLERTLRIYEGEVWFWLEITVADDATVGQETLELQVKVQACDRNRCLSPTTTTLRLPLEIRTEAAGQQQRHPVIFLRWPSSP